MDQSKCENDLFQISESCGVCEVIPKIPEDVGKFSVREQKIFHNISCYHWSMYWNRDLNVRKPGIGGTDLIQIIFFLNHGMSWEMEGISRPIEVCAGEFCIYRDFALPSVGIYEGGKELLFRSIQIPTAYFQEMISYYLDEKEQKQILEMIREVRRIRIPPRLYLIFEAMENSAQNSGGIFKLYMEGKITELIAGCLEAMLDSGRKLHSKLMTGDDIKAVMEIRQRIDLHCSDLPKLEVLAREAGIGSGKLMRGFKELTGKSLHSYIIDQRLQQAAQMLESGKYNVSQTAVACGYGNMSHFSAAFKKKYGVLPKYYKKC